MKTNIRAIEAVRVNPRCIDPAINVRESNLAEYKRTRSLEHLTYVEGVKPAVFVLDPISFGWVVNVCRTDGISETARHVAAFRGSCFSIRMPDGTCMEPTASEIISSSETRYTEESWVQRVAAKFGLLTVYELGAVALQRAELPEEQQGFFV